MVTVRTVKRGKTEEEMSQTKGERESSDTTGDRMVGREVQKRYGRVRSSNGDDNS